MTDAPADAVMHARLDSAAGYTIMASDLAPELPHNAGDSPYCQLRKPLPARPIHFAGRASSPRYGRQS
jgi:hypothetical protein